MEEKINVKTVNENISKKLMNCIVENMHYHKR